MRFLIIQIVIVILVCIFIAALSNLTELGFVGWILAGSTGHALFKIFKHMHDGMKSSKSPETSDFSDKMQSFMFDDATGLNDE